MLFYFGRSHFLSTGIIWNRYQLKSDNGRVIYTSVVVIGKGECKPDTQSGTKTETLSASSTVDFSDGSQPTKPTQPS